MTDCKEGPQDRPITRRLSALTLALCTAAGSAWSQAPISAPTATTDAVEWSQASQPLGSALTALALRTGLAIGVDTQVVRGKQAPALQGRYTPEQALGLLIGGSGLEAVRNASGGYALRATPAPTSGTASAAAAEGADAAQAHGSLSEINVVGDRTTVTEGTGSFTTDAPIATATGLPLTLRETPQSVSVLTRERMDDQGLSQVSDVLRQTPGLSFVQVGNAGTDSNSVYSRGFVVENYQIDGIPQTGSWLTQSGDLAFYDRVDVVRGATGLLNGVGTPAATINLVRKRPTREFQASALLSAGNWSRFRGEVDIGGPVNASGSVRARIAAAAQDNDSWIDRYSENKRLFYGIVEADLTPTTNLTAGVEYQKLDSNASARSGLPLYLSNGALSNYDRSASAAPNWAHSYQTQKQFFASVDQKLGGGWTLRALFNQARREYDDVLGYALNGYMTPAGTGLRLWQNRWNSEPVQNAGNLYVSGPFELFGRKHDLVVGYSNSRTKDEPPSYAGWTNAAIPNFYTWNGDFPTQPVSAQTGNNSTITKQTGAYATVRLRPTDALSVILGARTSDWKEDTASLTFRGVARSNSRREDRVVTPYAGIVFDLNDHWSVYGSFTDIFKPQTNKTVTGDYLDPLVGKAYEAGIKGSFYEDRLNVSAAVFEIKQDNLAVSLPNQFAPDGSQAYRAAAGTQTRGYELEAAGEVMSGWQIGTGFSHSVPRDSAGARLNTQVPKSVLKLFTTYRIASIGNGLTLGGGFNWQSEIYTAKLGPSSNATFTQASYGTLDLMARYPISKQVTLSVALNNVFDKTYYTSTTTSFYGAPRNLLVSLRATY